jgi:glycosyltransferase involved in cell wall biosynthesis
MDLLISVIVPVYKVEEYLPQCIDSILAQTYRNLEIILIDDGSPDRCPQICDEYARKDPRICVIHQNNQGVSAARNAGLDRAKGDYIGFVDSDDYIDPELFEKLLHLNEKYQTLISMCTYRVLKQGCNKNSNDEKSTDKEGLLSSENAIQTVLIPGHYNGSLCNKLFHRSLFDDEVPIRLDPSIFYCEDLLAVVQCMLRAKQVSYTTHPYYNYRCHRDSATRFFNQKSLTSFAAREKIISVLSPELSVFAKASYTNEASNFLCQSYGKNSKNIISYLQRARNKYLLDFRRISRYFSLKDRIRVWGTGLLAPVFCRAWNIIKFIRVFLLRLKMISTKIV